MSSRGWPGRERCGYCGCRAVAGLRATSSWMLAKQRYASSYVVLEPAVLLNKESVRTLTIGETNKYWEGYKSCRQAIADLNSLTTNRQQFWFLVSVLAGYCKLNRHLSLFGQRTIHTVLLSLSWNLWNLYMLRYELFDVEEIRGEDFQVLPWTEVITFN